MRASKNKPGIESQSQMALLPNVNSYRPKESAIRLARDLAVARFSVSIQTHRLLALALAQVTAQIRDIESTGGVVTEMPLVRFDAEMFCHYFRCDPRKVAEFSKSACEEAMISLISHWSSDSWESMVWATWAAYRSKERVIEFQLNNRLLKYVGTRLRTVYTEYSIEDLMDLNTSYQYVLYQITKSYVDEGFLEISFSDLLKVLCIEKNDYYRSSPSKLNAKILKPSFKAINERSDISVIYEMFVKKGDLGVPEKFYRFTINLKLNCISVKAKIHEDGNVETSIKVVPPGNEQTGVSAKSSRYSISDKDMSGSTAGLSDKHQKVMLDLFENDGATVDASNGVVQAVESTDNVEGHVRPHTEEQDEQDQQSAKLIAIFDELHSKYKLSKKQITWAMLIGSHMFNISLIMRGDLKSILDEFDSKGVTDIILLQQLKYVQEYCRKKGARFESPRLVAKFIDQCYDLGFDGNWEYEDRQKITYPYACANTDKRNEWQDQVIEPFKIFIDEKIGS